MSKNLSELSGRKGMKDNLFEALGRTSEQEGTPSKSDLAKLAEEFLMGKANTYGTASFYDFTREENKGKKVYVCNGSACMMAKTQDGLKDTLKGHFKEEEIGEMCCLGRCHENTSFHYDGKNYSAKNVDEIGEIIGGKKEANIDNYNIASHGEVVLTGAVPELEEYYSLWESVLKGHQDDILEVIKKSGVRGRGGAGFPMGFKLESCKNTPSKEKFIVCNADEGDPGAFSDRYLMEKQPHAVLFGMMVAGFITGAESGVLYIRAEYPESISIMEEAVKTIREKGWIGDNIKGSGINFEFKVVAARGAYICGEETALLSSLEGQRPEVRVRPPYPTQQGLFNRPTVVNNVETLACLHYILKNGAEKFAGIGTGKSSGTKLLSLDSFFNKPGLYEVEMGTPLSLVINALGGGFKEPIKGMHIGGPLGGLVPIGEIDKLTVDFESFAENGFLLGHASVVCIPESYPILNYLEHLFQFTAHESCGKCFPCRLGSTRGYEMLNKADNSDYKVNRQLFEDLLHTLEIGSLCALGGGLPLPIYNALEYFEEELAPYFESN